VPAGEPGQGDTGHPQDFFEIPGSILLEVCKLPDHALGERLVASVRVTGDSGQIPEQIDDDRPPEVGGGAAPVRSMSRGN